MATSQNGWPVLTSAPAYRSKWVTGRLAPTAAPLLEYLAEQFDKRVEPINRMETIDDDWGWTYKKISGSNTYSNHASGTAIDLNATRHPQFKAGTFTPAQVAEIRKILAELEGTVRWGGDYPANRLDAMHFEINATPAKVAAVAKKLGAAPIEANEVAITKPGGTLKLGVSGNEVRNLQAGLNRVFPGYAKLNVTGVYDAPTREVVKEFQRRAKTPGGPDGIVGDHTRLDLAKHGIRL